MNWYLHSQPGCSSPLYATQEIELENVLNHVIASDTNGAKRTVQHFGKYAYLLSCRKSEKTDTIVMSALGTISHCRLEFNPLKHRHKSIPLASSNLMGKNVHSMFYRHLTWAKLVISYKHFYKRVAPLSWRCKSLLCWADVPSQDETAHVYGKG